EAEMDGIAAADDTFAASDCHLSIAAAGDGNGTAADLHHIDLDLPRLKPREVEDGGASLEGVGIDEKRLARESPCRREGSGPRTARQLQPRSVRRFLQSAIGGQEIAVVDRMDVAAEGAGAVGAIGLADLLFGELRQEAADIVGIFRPGAGQERGLKRLRAAARLARNKFA